MSYLGNYIKETLDIAPDKFAIDVARGILGEARANVSDDATELLTEIVARTAGMLSPFIDCAQKVCKNGNTYELEGMLGAIRFRFGDTQNGGGN